MAFLTGRPRIVFSELLMLMQDVSKFGAEAKMATHFCCQRIFGGINVNWFAYLVTRQLHAFSS